MNKKKMIKNKAKTEIQKITKFIKRKFDFCFLILFLFYCFEMVLRKQNNSVEYMTFILVYAVLNIISKIINMECLYIPITKTRITKKDTNGNISIEKEDIQKAITYLGMFEDYLEERGYRNE